MVDTATGAVAQRLDYDEWGNVTLNTNPGFQPFGYAGGLVDMHTGLVRFGVRDYDATTGRWTAKDPLRFHAGGTNLYAYSGLDPINNIDPTGTNHGDTHWVPGKHGTPGPSDLVPCLRNALPIINQAVRDLKVPKYDAVWVVSTTGGAHNTPAHKEGRAIDIRIWTDPAGDGPATEMNPDGSGGIGYLSAEQVDDLAQALQAALDAEYGKDKFTVTRERKNPWPASEWGKRKWSGPHIDIRVNQCP